MNSPYILFISLYQFMYFFAIFVTLWIFSFPSTKMCRVGKAFLPTVHIIGGHKKMCPPYKVMVCIRHFGAGMGAGTVGAD